MTNDEAINTLKNTAWLGSEEQAEKVSEAVQMAVEALKAQLTEKDTTSDCISRQAAIRIASGYCHPANVAKELAKLPSAQPQRMSGKWTYGEDEYGIDGYHCDKCGFFVPWDYTHKFIDFIKDYHFCPYCGADMRGEQDEY
jgi:hypothetical protein